MKKIDHTQFILGSVMAKKNMSGTVLAERLGVTRQTVNNMVNGRRDVTVSRLHDIARALGVNVKELFK